MHEDGQRGSHAHSAWFVPGNSGIIFVDQGTNELWFHELDTLNGNLLPAELHKLAMDPGTGPRHLAFHPDRKYIYVVNELNSTVTVVEKNVDGAFEKGPSYTTLPECYAGINYCADIHITSDGNFVYSSNRGRNSIAIFEKDQGEGTLALLGHQSTCGEWPRNFAFSPDENYLVVANRHSNKLVSIKRDRFTGCLEPVDTLEISSPACILF